MVDCIYYEEMNLDKSRAEQLFHFYFGKDATEYDLNCELNYDPEKSLIFTKEQILSPDINDFILINKFLYRYKEARPDVVCGGGNEKSFARYNSILMIMAIMSDCIAPSQLDEWLGKSPELRAFYYQGQK